MLRKCLRLGSYFVFVSSILYLASDVRLFKISSGSMAGTILPNDYVFVHRVGWLTGSKPGLPLPRGRIVILRVPQGSAMLAKRVIAIGGDTVRIRGGRVIINGTVLSEPYLPKTSPDNIFYSWPLDMHGAGLSEVFVPPQSYFVMGDNRGESTDSRHWGPVPEEAVYGSVFFIWHHRIS